MWSLSLRSCPLLSHLFDRLDLLPPLRKELAELPPSDHPPSRFIVEKPDFDGWTEARARGSGLEKFFKVGQWRCRVGTCELGTELERVGKRFQSLTEEVLDQGLGR